MNFDRAISINRSWPMKAILFTISALLAMSPSLLIAQVQSRTLEKLSSCQMVQANWADGDSFLIQTSQGVQHTIRLYGVDCIEMEVRDANDASRLRTQRRYFGISDAGASPQASVTIAKEYGKLAAAETAKALDRSFSVYTSFADARGDANFKRIYAFVTTADGEDLGEHLVRLGLARAFGVYRETPDGLHHEAYKERLRDLELVASRKGIGVWAKTDWDKLPLERQLERNDDAELGLAIDAKKTTPTASLDLNTAAREELMSIPGVGEVTANRIIQGRPYVTFEDLGKVNGIGPKTLDTIRKYVRIREQ